MVETVDTDWLALFSQRPSPGAVAGQHLSEVIVYANNTLCVAGKYINDHTDFKKIPQSVLSRFSFSPVGVPEDVPDFICRLGVPLRRPGQDVSRYKLPGGWVIVVFGTSAPAVPEHACPSERRTEKSLRRFIDKLFLHL